VTRPGPQPPRDPFEVLGVDPTAGEEELRAARRRLAKDLHPDRAGGDATRMRELNLAFDAALAAVQAAPWAPAGTAPPRPAPTSRRPASPPPRPPSPPGRRPSGTRPDGARRSGSHHAHDVASFTIEALPAEAFEALLVASSWLGELIDDDPPYRLDVDLGEPFDCWCRLDLVPDAGASTVGVTLASRDGRPVPDLDSVRDTWVATLNTLGRPEPA
jgi:hypothetical protein